MNDNLNGPRLSVLECRALLAWLMSKLSIRVSNLSNEQLERELSKALEDAQAWRRLALDLRKEIETFMSDMDSEWLIYALENAVSDIRDARSKLRKALEVTK